MAEQWRRFREKLRLCDPVDASLDGSAILPIVVGDATRWIRLDKLISIARGMSGGGSVPASPVVTPAQSFPTGTIVATLGPVPPGWLKCSGALVPRAQYPKLYAVIGNAYGKNDGVSTFQLPEIKTQLTPGKTPDVSWIIAT